MCGTGSSKNKIRSNDRKPIRCRKHSNLHEMWMLWHVWHICSWFCVMHLLFQSGDGIVRLVYCMCWGNLRLQWEIHKMNAGSVKPLGSFSMPRCKLLQALQSCEPLSPVSCHCWVTHFSTEVLQMLLLLKWILLKLIMIFEGMMPYSLVDMYQCSGEICHHQLHLLKSHWNLEAVGHSEMSVLTCKTTWRHIASNIGCCEIGLLWDPELLLPYMFQFTCILLLDAT